MAEKEEVFKIIILFLFFLFGCSHKYVNIDGESLDAKVVASWIELDADAIRVYEGGVRLNICVKDFKIISKQLRLKEVYEYNPVGPKKNDLKVLGGVLIGCSGCFLGYYGGAKMDKAYAQSTKSLLFPTFSSIGCVSGCLFSLPGLILWYDGLSKEREHVEISPDFVKIDTICVDSMSLSNKKVKVLIEKSGLEKTYYADEDGSIELKFDEIIPEPTEADSILNLNIQYEEMVDTVSVKIKKVEN